MGEAELIIDHSIFRSRYMQSSTPNSAIWIQLNISCLISLGLSRYPLSILDICRDILKDLHSPVTLCISIKHWSQDQWSKCLNSLHLHHYHEVGKLLYSLQHVKIIAVLGGQQYWQRHSTVSQRSMFSLHNTYQSRLRGETIVCDRPRQNQWYCARHWCEPNSRPGHFHFSTDESFLHTILNSAT